MCGIIAEFNKKNIKANDFIVNQYEEQYSRGQKGFGIIRIDKKGKFDSQKMADLLFTLGYEFKSQEELDAVLGLVVENVISVRAWGWKPEGKDEAIQFHAVKGQGSSVKDSNGDVAAPF